MSLCIESNKTLVVNSTPKRAEANTPSSLLRKNLKKKVSQQPENVSYHISLSESLNLYGYLDQGLDNILKISFLGFYI